MQPTSISPTFLSSAVDISVEISRTGEWGRPLKQQDIQAIGSASLGECHPPGKNERDFFGQCLILPQLDAGLAQFT
jgi:hypothetical protein